MNARKMGTVSTVAGWTFLALLWVGGSLFPLSSMAGAAGNSAIESLRQTGKAFAEVAKKVSPAVVFIKVEKKVEGGAQIQQIPLGDDFLRHFFGIPGPGDRGMRPRPMPPSGGLREIGQGSGFIVSADGYILSNNHVVGDADKITVTLKDGRDFKAKLIGADSHSDVAVIKIDAKNLPVLALGDSDALEVGEWVLAVGNPFGLSHTLTAGIVSAKGRSRVGITDYEDFIQTDAAINPGNSGGPLVDLDGKAVGMNTAIFSKSGGYMGIGFAIPINMARSIMAQLIDHGSVTRGYLGIVIQNLTPELIQSFSLDKKTKGILVAQVTPDSPAAKAGVKRGDVIVEFNGKPTVKVGTFRNRVALKSPGSKSVLVVLRDGKRKVLHVKIGKLPDHLLAGGRGGQSTHQAERLGLVVQNLTPDIAEQLNVKGEKGVVITNVRPDSPAAMAGLRPGTLIKEVNRHKVENVEDFQRILKKVKKGDMVLMLVREGEFARYVALQLN